MEKDYVFVNQTSARNVFWAKVRELRRATFDDLATGPLAAQGKIEELHLTESRPDSPRIERQVDAAADEVRKWQARWNLGAEWCFNWATGQLLYWSGKPDRLSRRTPYRGAVDLLVHADGDSSHENARLIDVRESSYYPDLPEELIFSIPDGWRVNEAEMWRYAEARLRKMLKGGNLRAYLGQYRKRIEKMLRRWDRWKSYRLLHFEWLVKRVVPENQSGEVLSCRQIMPPPRQGEKLQRTQSGKREIVPSVEVSRQTVALAAFIELDIPGAKRGPAASRRSV